MTPPAPLASPESDAATPGTPSITETAPSPSQGSKVETDRPDRAEIERELLTRVQEVAVETVFAHLADSEIDPAPLAVDLVLGIEAAGHIRNP